MNIKNIRDGVARMMAGANLAIERIEGKENVTERDERRIEALAEFHDAIEAALDDLNADWED